MKKKYGLYILAAGLASVGLAVLESKRELNSLIIRKVKLEYSGENDQKPVRIVYFADFHEACGGRMNQRIEDAIRSLCPDLILIGGDMLSGYESFDELPSVDLIDRIHGIAPVVMAPGNHERKALENYYDDNGLLYNRFMTGVEDKIHYLSNDSKLFSFGGKWIRVSGLDIPLDYYRRGEKKELFPEDIDNMIGACPDDGKVFNLLLAHNPEYFETYASWGADLTLSGHFHGGIINLPLIGGVISPRLSIFPKYTKGVYRSEDTPGKTMYLTSGIGQHSLKIKINNLPEIIMLELFI